MFIKRSLVPSKYFMGLLMGVTLTEGPHIADLMSIKNVWRVAGRPAPTFITMSREFLLMSDCWVELTRWVLLSMVGVSWRQDPDKWFCHFLSSRMPCFQRYRPVRRAATGFPPPGRGSFGRLFQGSLLSVGGAVENVCGVPSQGQYVDHY